MTNNLEILKLLADETRLKILNILLGEDSYVEKIACDLGLTPATVCYHLKKLESAGIVNCSRSQFYIIYSINREIFDKPLYELVRVESAVDPEERYKKNVISNFFKCGKLVSLPKQQKKREIVLREIASAFEKGRDYVE
ncbi:MAG: metalloregulator ArsR/SmtB family transcription factor, partial [Clostridia bacterium]|nr:metalloregulator ArsR/SmtB family transcription factor [Clostridia bacterium]